MLVIEAVVVIVALYNPGTTTVNSMQRSRSLWPCATGGHAIVNSMPAGNVHCPSEVTERSDNYIGVSSWSQMWLLPCRTTLATTASHGLAMQGSESQLNPLPHAHQQHLTNTH
eukprot:5604473-Amphidinium_carterae.1